MLSGAYGPTVGGTRVASGITVKQGGAVAATEITSWTALPGTRALGERLMAHGAGQGRGEAEGVSSHDLTFADFIDIINPLQHIPIVGSIYRELVGDEISGVARVMGDFLYGGPLGLLTGVANASIEQSTGSDIGEHAMAWLTGGDDVPAPLAEPVVAAIVPAVEPIAIVDGNDAALAALAADLRAGATITPPLAALPIEVVAAPTSTDAVAQYQHILETMQAALDRYDAQKATKPDEPSSP